MSRADGTFRHFVLTARATSSDAVASLRAFYFAFAPAYATTRHASSAAYCRMSISRLPRRNAITYLIDDDFGTSPYAMASSDARYTTFLVSLIDDADSVIITSHTSTNKYTIESADEREADFCALLLQFATVLPAPSVATK